MKLEVRRRPRGTCSDCWFWVLVVPGQAEERTIWQTPETYMKMSPFLMADRISKPLLLVHGEDDNNSGTFPMQSERFYSALKVGGPAAS